MDTQAKTVRLPKDLYQWLRRTAFEWNKSQNDIIVAALTEYRRREERKS
jgi:predicted transcriptional regulator